MNYEPNVLGVEFLINDVLPKLDMNYSLKVIGARVLPKLKKLENERVNFLGYVDSVKKELLENDIFLCPIIAGAGTKNKILQAAAMGLPIVCTKMSLEGINDEIKSVVYIANDEEEFVKQIYNINNTDEDELSERLNYQAQIIRKYNSLEMVEKKLVKLLSYNSQFMK